MSLKLKVPPPVVALATAIIMWGISRASRDFAIRIPGSRVVAAAVALCGVLIAISGVRSFKRARTTVNPMRPASATSLVECGIYRRTRNPMYLGLLLVLLAVAVLLSNPFSLVGPVAFVLYMNRFQIGPEEAALTEVFGAPYADYKRRVRRWV